MSGKKRAADEIVTIFKGSKKKPKSHKKPRAKWSKEETSLLVDKLNEGERVSDLLHFFPKKRKQQVHSKVSNLKQKKLVSVQRESIAPSSLAMLANHQKVMLSQNPLKVLAEIALIKRVKSVTLQKSPKKRFREEHQS